MNAIWIGLFTVTGQRDNTFLNGDAGACLWVAAQAEGAAKLRMRVDSIMKTLELTVVEVEQLQEVGHEDELSEQQAVLIPEARGNVESVVCGTWHRFKSHDA